MRLLQTIALLAVLSSPARAAYTGDLRGQGLYASTGAVSFNMTAGTYTGSGYGLFNYIVTASSDTNSSLSVASTMYIGVSTATADFRGNRQALILMSTRLLNSSGGSRTYDILLTYNGAPIQPARQETVPVGDDRTLTIFALAPTSIGVANISVLFKVNNFNGSQTVFDTHLSALEY